ncbi:hypothetical protein TNCV_1056561 [Trichonephila clavipes]|nr:hypothetical protein TNCV_1056561 [Trichonephila clavipes]
MPLFFRRQVSGPVAHTVAHFKLRAKCKNSVDLDEVPTLPLSNGFVYPPKQHELPTLDPVSARRDHAIILKLPFMEICQLHYDDSYGIIGQVINVAVDVETI